MVKDNLHNNIFKSEHWTGGNIESALNSGFEVTDEQIIKQSIEQVRCVDENTL
jgi:hypothetical protein